MLKLPGWNKYGLQDDPTSFLERIHLNVGLLLVHALFIFIPYFIMAGTSNISILCYKRHSSPVPEEYSITQQKETLSLTPDVFVAT